MKITYTPEEVMEILLADAEERFGVEIVDENASVKYISKSGGHTITYENITLIEVNIPNAFGI